MLGKAREQFAFALRKLLLQAFVMCRIKLIVPGRQHGLIQRAPGFFAHCVIPDWSHSSFGSGRQSF
jgi:hypothetical protein